jgi:hypothetical protein
MIVEAQEDASKGKAAQVPRDVKQFLGAVFRKDDYVCIRPVESYTDAETGKKVQRIVYGQIRYHKSSALATDGQAWRNMLANAAHHKANLFFSVAPRCGPQSHKEGGRYDLAWQIRTIRVLWADLDHCTVEEAIKRCEKAGLPRPSIIIRSGHGVHLYWILTDPYLVDDAGEPPAVYTEFIDQGEGKKKLTRKLIQEGDGCIYLFLPDKKGGDSGTPNPESDWGELSPKAQHFQDVLAGIASKIGGDHTKDLARLLRLPGTLNRKDERNGKEPVPCEVVECDKARCYPLVEFERYAGASPDRRRRETIKKIHLPSVRKLTARRTDSLNNLINSCAVASIGTRSERDWNLICWCIENGVDPDEAWQRVADIGKFAESGRGYFDRTWEKAQGHTREKIYEKEQRKAEKAAQTATPSTGSGDPEDPGQGGEMVAMMATVYKNLPQIHTGWHAHT